MSIITDDITLLACLVQDLTHIGGLEGADGARPEVLKYLADPSRCEPDVRDAIEDLIRASEALRRLGVIR